jgi:hypothetical protein
MALSHRRLLGIGPNEELKEPFVVSYDAGDGNLPSLLPDWPSVKPKVFSASIRSDTRLTPRDSPRTAVIIHAYHEEGLGILLGRLRDNIWPASFFITTDSKDKACRINKIATDALGCGVSMEVRLTPNRGRDALPFWISLREDASDHDIFFKLHLKRSAHIASLTTLGEETANGQDWYEDILRCLIPLSAKCFRSMQALREPGYLAALYPRPWKPLAMYGWGMPTNLHWVAEILKGQGMHALNLLLPLIFPVGNMFIGSVTSFLPFADYFIEAVEPPPEPTPIDGTVLHGIERCYSYLLAAKGENVGVLYPSQPGDIDGEVRWWSFPLSVYALRLDASTEDSTHLDISHLVAKLGLASMERHCRNAKEIDRLERQRNALQEQIQVLSRSPPLRRVLTRLLRGK